MTRILKSMRNISPRSCGWCATSPSNSLTKIRSQSPQRTTWKRLFRLRRVSAKQLTRKTEFDACWNHFSKSATVAPWLGPWQRKINCRIWRTSRSRHCDLNSLNRSTPCAARSWTALRPNSLTASPLTERCSITWLNRMLTPSTLAPYHRLSHRGATSARMSVKKLHRTRTKSSKSFSMTSSLTSAQCSKQNWSKFSNKLSSRQWLPSTKQQSVRSEKPSTFSSSNRCIRSLNSTRWKMRKRLTKSAKISFSATTTRSPKNLITTSMTAWRA